MKCSPSYAIGDTGPAGGIVFYITDGGLHGLEAAPFDQHVGSGAAWGCMNTTINGADGAAIGTGAQNTADILAGCKETGIAAEIATEYSGGGFTGWFLPSYDELNALHTALNVDGFLPLDQYWSSTGRNTISFAMILNITSPTFKYGNRTSLQGVRPVRAF